MRLQLCVCVLGALVLYRDAQTIACTACACVCGHRGDGCSNSYSACGVSPGVRHGHSQVSSHMYPDLHTPVWTWPPRVGLVSASSHEVEMRSGLGNFPDGLEDPGAFLARPETHLRASQPSSGDNSQPHPSRPAMSGGRHGTLKGLLGWVCGWTRAWRAGLGTAGCGLPGLCPGEPPSVAEVSGGLDS